MGDTTAAASSLFLVLPSTTLLLYYYARSDIPPLFVPSPFRRTFKSWF